MATSNYEDDLAAIAAFREKFGLAHRAVPVPTPCRVDEGIQIDIRHPDHRYVVEMVGPQEGGRWTIETEVPDEDVVEGYRLTEETHPDLEAAQAAYYATIAALYLPQVGRRPLLTGHGKISEALVQYDRVARALGYTPAEHREHVVLYLADQEHRAALDLLAALADRDDD